MLNVLSKFVRGLFANRNSKTPKKVNHPVRTPGNSASLENLEGRALLAASPLVLGLNVNSSPSLFPVVNSMLGKTGTNAVRLWHGVNDWNTFKVSNALKMAVQYKSAGYDVMIIVNSTDGVVPSTTQVRNYFNAMMDSPGVAAAVDRWEVGNEPDRPDYWKGTIKSYVTNLLKPAAEVLHAHGEKVVSAGPSWDPDDIKQMADAGMVSYVDYVGYHPYRQSVGDLKLKIADVKAIVGSKPLIASEWNVRGHEAELANGIRTPWANEIKEFWPIIRDNFYAAYYFNAVKNTSMAGVAGVINSDGSPNQPFYDVVNSFQHNMTGDSFVVSPGGGNTGGTGTGGTTGGGTGGTTVTPAVSTIGLFNATTDKAIAGFESITSGKVIDLADTGTKNLTFVANASNSSSVKFVFNNSSTVVENVAPYAAFGGNSDLAGRTFTPGSYSLVVTPYAQDNGTGTAGTAKTINFTVVDTGSTPSTTVTAPVVKAFSIVNAATGVALPGFSNITASQTIKLSSLPTRNINILAIGNATVASMIVTFNGATHTENDAPYTMIVGPNKSKRTWVAAAGQTLTLTAKAYSKDGGLGTASASKSITLKFV